MHMEMNSILVIDDYVNQHVNTCSDSNRANFIMSFYSTS